MTNQEIIATGQTIANETHIGGNTAERVGGVIEGIGENLTELEGNLVESGVVYEKFLNIKKLISGFIPTTCTFTVSDDGETISVSAGHSFYGNTAESVTAHTIDTTILEGNFGYLCFDLSESKYSVTPYASTDIENSIVCGVFRPTNKTLALFDAYWMAFQLNNLAASVYYTECASPAGNATKTVSVDNYFNFLNGGCLKIKMQYGHTYNNGANLRINNLDTKPLYYNGRPCIGTNVWQAGDIIEVFYDGTAFQAFSTANAFKSGQNLNSLSLVEEVPAFDEHSDSIAIGRAVLKALDNTVADKAGKLTDFFMYQNWLLSNGNYLGKSINYSNYKCICVPVNAGDIIRISKGESQNAYCAFLKSLSNVDNLTVETPAADLCSGESRMTIEAVASNPQTLTAPSDAAYLYIGIYNGYDVVPYVFSINGYDYKKSVKEYIISLRDSVLELDTKIDSELYIQSVSPTAGWEDKSFNTHTGTDGIFFDKRNKISNINELVKIGVKARYNGIVKIHYLSTTSPYAEIANETHNVVAGINEFTPTASFSYEQEMYVAFSNDAANSPGIMLVYPSDHTGQSIKKVIATGVISEQDYPYALWIYINKSKLSDIEEKISEAGGITTLSALKKALSDNIGHIRLGAGTITLDDTLSIPSGTKITGIRGKSVINVPASVLNGIELRGKEDIVIEGITLVGAYNGTPVKSGMQPVKPGIVDTANDARAFVNANYQSDMTNGGVTQVEVPQIGINIYDCERIEIIGCEIKNFSNCGLCVGHSGTNYRYACKFEKNYINNCYCGIKTYNEAERSQYIANNISLCQIGLYTDSGTNMFTDNSYTANRIGMLMNNGWNQSHDVHTGNAYTHCSLFSILAFDIEMGAVFEQCKIGYNDQETENQSGEAGTLFKNSRGFTFVNCQLIQSGIYVDGKFVLHGQSKSNGSIDVFGNTPYVVTYEDLSANPPGNGGITRFMSCSIISPNARSGIRMSSDLNSNNVILKDNYLISGDSNTTWNN